MRIDIEEHLGEVDVKSAYIHGLDSFAIKIASGFPENRKSGLPSGSGMMVLISAQTGLPLAVLLDNGYLTDVRTGIAGAIAAQYLAPELITNAGVIGSGVQARYQMQALKLVRDYQKLFVGERMPGRGHCDPFPGAIPPGGLAASWFAYYLHGV
jgi:ornithine cyclodeaminase